MGLTVKSPKLDVPNYYATILKNQENQVNIHQYH